VRIRRREKLSRAYRNQAVSAIKFLYKEVLDLPERVSELPYLRKEHTLPVVLSREEVQRLLNAVTNLKHRAILMVIYSAGLRVGEAVRLKVADIDSDRGMIFVRGGKGRKDRYTLLSDTALQTLRAYWKKYRPKKWLFPGARPGRHITARTIQKVFERARDAAKIRKDATVHTLRHSFATHLLEEGVDVRYIKELLGHKRMETTMVYTHVSARNLAHIRSPLDSLSLEGGDVENTD